MLQVVIFASVGVSLLSLTQGFLIQSHWAVQPGQVFSFSCEEPSSLPSRWRIYDWAQLEGTKTHDNRSSIECFLSTEERFLVSATCRNALGKWITTQFPYPWPVPVTITFDTICFGGIENEDIEYLHIGLLPGPPSNLECLLKDFNVAFCRWDHDPSKYIGDGEYRTPTNYIITYNSMDRRCYPRNFRSCVVNSDQKWCEEVYDHKKHGPSTLFLCPFKVSVTARNELGEATASIKGFLPSVTSAPERVTIRSVRRKQKARLIIGFTTASPAIFDVKYQVQVVYSRLAPKDLLNRLELNPEHLFWEDWKTMGSKAFETRQAREDTQFWKRAVTHSGVYNKMKKINIVVRSNTTAAVRVRIREDYDRKNEWSNFSKATVVVTKATKS